MPHKDKDGYATRTTEACSSIECEEKAYHYRTVQEKLEKGELISYPVKDTFSSVRGTVGHHKIQIWIERKMDIPETPFVLTPGAQRLYNTIQAEPVMKKKFDEQVANAYFNFGKWWDEFEPIPLAVELTMVTVVKGRRIKGQVDFVCLIKESKLNKALKVKVPQQSDEYRLVIVDWKTGKTVMEQHKAQIAAYYYNAHKSALIPFLRKHKYYEYNNKPYGIDVYLGAPEPKTVMFKIEMYRFFAAVELFNKARRIPIDRSKGGILHEGGMSCYFCPFTDRCSTIMRTEMTILELDDFNKAESVTVILK